MDDWLLPVLILMLFICAAFASDIAHGKGRDAFGWFFLGLLFGPLGVLAAAMTSPIHENSAAPSHSPGSVADELAKLAALRDQGVISDEELAVQKSRLLA